MTTQAVEIFEKKVKFGHILFNKTSFVLIQFFFIKFGIDAIRNKRKKKEKQSSKKKTTNNQNQIHWQMRELLICILVFYLIITFINSAFSGKTDAIKKTLSDKVDEKKSQIQQTKDELIVLQGSRIEELEQGSK